MNQRWYRVSLRPLSLWTEGVLYSQGEIDMIEKPMDALRYHPVRKSKRQKSAFREGTAEFFKKMGYSCSEEKGSFGSRNVIVGNPKTAEFLVTAHYDTCARLLFPNFITPCNFLTFVGYQLFTVAFMFVFVLVFAVLVTMLTQNSDIAFYASYGALWLLVLLMLFGPANKHNANDNTSGVVTVMEIASSLPEELRDRVCFVLFDLEEAGLIGSASYQSKHKTQTRKQIVLNLDCVGDGDEIVLFPTGKLKKETAVMDRLRDICGTYGGKKITVKEKGFSVYPSDQGNFPLGVGIAAFRRSWVGLYLSRIHTPRDTVLDQDNVNTLRDQLIKLIAEAQCNKKGNVL